MPSEDIVDLLRDAKNPYCTKLRVDAADEIGRLRKLIQDAADACEKAERQLIDYGGDGFASGLDRIVPRLRKEAGAQP